MPDLWIRRPFQRDREPHGQDRSDAAKEVNLATRNERRARQTYSPCALSTRGGRGQPWTITVRVDCILTEMKVVLQNPEMFVLTVKRGSGNKDRDCTSMRLKDIWIYVCAATITKTYIVASETIV